MSDKPIRRFMKTPEVLLAEYRQSARGKTIDETIDLLKAHGFVFDKPLQKANSLYRHEEFKDLTVAIPTNATNVGRPLHKEVIELCDEVNQRSHTPKVTLKSFIEDVTIDYPEIHEEVTIKSTDKKDAMDRAIGDAIEKLKKPTETYGKIIQSLQADYGISFVRQNAKNKLVFSSADLRIREELNYEKASPQDVIDFVTHIRDRADKIHMERLELIHTFEKDAGGKVTETIDSYIMMAGDDKAELFVIPKLSDAGFIDAEGTAKIRAEISTYIERQQKKDEREKASEPEPQPHVEPVQDGFWTKKYPSKKVEGVAVDIVPRSSLNGSPETSTATKSMMISEQGKEAKQGLFDILSHVTGRISKQELFEYIGPKLKISQAIVTQFFDPDSNVRPQSIKPADLKDFRGRTLGLIAREIKASDDEVLTEVRDQLLKTAEKLFKDVQKEIDRTAKDHSDPVAKTYKS